MVEAGGRVRGESGAGIMAGGHGAGAAFPRVASLGELGEDAAAKLGVVYALLQDTGAAKAAERLLEIDADIGRLDYPALETRVDPDLVNEELADSYRAHVRIAHMLRNITALVPLLITWLALGWASREYRNELARIPSDATKPFLLLWEQGFGQHGLFAPTFAEVALVDFVIIVLLLGLTGWVHQSEGREESSRARVMHSLWTALAALKLATERNMPRPPATAEEWANAARSIISDAMEETRLLSESSKKAIDEAGSRLEGIQDQGKEFIAQYSTEIQATLVDVRRQNEDFIRQIAEESRETLRLLVQQQMEPLLNQLRTMLGEFGRHQETYRTGISGLTESVTTIKGSAQDLAESARAHNDAAESITKNLESIAVSQSKLASTLSSSAASIETTATAMGQVKDVLRTELRDGVRQMTDNVTAASGHLATIEQRLADTSKALDGSSKALNSAAGELRKIAATPARTASLIRRIIRQLLGR
jgi:methyl-accepting chemotaxis protein